MFGVKYKSVGGSRSSRKIGGQMLVLVLVTCMCGVATSIRIKHFFVPELANLKSADPIRLECDVEISPDERSKIIVIQWYLNDTQLYLWSQNRTSKTPFIDTNFISSMTINGTKFRNSTLSAPLTITNKTTNLTGMYKCLATMNVVDEVYDSDTMKMYVPIDNITLDHIYNNETNQLNVTCGTENVYPRPEIKLFINGEENLTTTTDPILDVRLNENQLFDISATYTISISNLPSSSKINCVINLPEVRKSSSRSTYYNKSGYPDDQMLDTDETSTNNLTAQGSNAPGGRSTLSRINSYLIFASVLLMARGFI